MNLFASGVCLRVAETKGTWLMLCGWPSYELRIPDSRFSDVLQLTYLCLCLYVHFNLLYSRGGQVLQNPAHASFMGFVQ